MRPLPLLGLLLLGATLAACGGGGGGDDGPPQGVADFLHFTTTENTTSSSTALDHPLANGNPDARIFFTHNYNPSGAGGDYFEGTCFVGYDPSGGRWHITNILGPMPIGLYFNVTVVSGFASAWKHVASAGNIVANGTELDNASVTGDPSALILATKAAPDTDGLFIMPTHEIGVWYDGPAWQVFFEDLGAVMSAGNTFHVHALPHDGASFQHVATVGNISGHWTELSHPDADGNPAAHIQVTKRLDSSEPYHEARIGVWYDDSTGHWNIYNEDFTAMAPDTRFNVRVK